MPALAMTHKPRIIQVPSLAGSPTVGARLAQHYEVFPLWQQADRKAALAEHGRGVTAIVTSANIGASAELIHALPDLKAICSWGVGYDTIDLACARERGILVSNTPDVLTDCVADMAWGLLIAAARRMGQGDRLVRSGEWDRGSAVPFGIRVSGKKLGVIGLGRIGDAIARRGLGFDMEIRYHNRRRRDDVIYGYEASLSDLAAWADFLVVATVGGAGTYHLVDRKILTALGPNGVIVNIARGSVIDEVAMAELLESGQLGAAGLDVYEHEPHVPAALKACDNTFLTPHVGSASYETRLAMENLMLDNLASFFATGKVLTPVQ